MGYLNHIVVAALSEIQRIADSSNPLKQWPGAEDVGLWDESVLERLYCLLSGNDDMGAAFDKSWQRHAESTVDPTAFATAFSDDLAKLLAGLDSGRLEELSAGWAESVEVVMSLGWSRQSARQTLETLRDLAQRAQSQDKALISWVSE